MDEFEQFQDIDDFDIAIALSLQGDINIEGHSSKKQDDESFQKMDEDLDLAIALSMQEEFNEESSLHAKNLISNGHSSKSSLQPMSLIDSQWELIDPNPDIHGLFLEFNTKFFYGKLLGVEVKWSTRMTLCAGVCSYEGRGGLCSVRLSLPLLKLRPRKDLVETLLHEMIHAYLFVTGNNKDHDGHGPEFLSHMYRINKESGTTITVYHSFHDEVDEYRKHWWKCNGPCQHRKPFYGIVRRVMNRAPGPRDAWWAEHKATCGGTYTKIKEPENFKQKKAKRNRENEPVLEKSKDIKNFFHPTTSSSAFPAKKPKNFNASTAKTIFADETVASNAASSSSPTPATSHLKEKNSAIPFAGKGFTLGTSSQPPKTLLSKIRKELVSKTSMPTKERTSKISMPAKELSTKKSIPAKELASKKSIPAKELASKKSIPAKELASKISIPAKELASKKSMPDTEVLETKYAGQSSNGISSKNNLKSHFISNDAGIHSGVFVGKTPERQSENSRFVQSSLDKYMSSPKNTLNDSDCQVVYSTARTMEKESSHLVTCPICSQLQPNETINEHLDECLPTVR